MQAVKAGGFMPHRIIPSGVQIPFPLPIYLGGIMSLTNYNKLAFLEEGTYTTVRVSFLEDSVNRTYIYKLHNSMVPLARDNSFAVVPTASGYKTVKIEEIHVSSELDYNKSYAWKWIVDIIDDTWYNKQIEAEENTLKLLTQEKIKKKLADDLGGDIDSLRKQVVT